MSRPNVHVSKALPLSSYGECVKVKCSVCVVNAVKCNAEAICREEPVGSLPLELDLGSC